MKTNAEQLEILIEKAVKEAKNSYLETNMELNVYYDIKKEEFDMMWEQSNCTTSGLVYLCSIKGYYDDEVDENEYWNMLTEALDNLKDYEIVTKKQIIRMKNLIKKMDITELNYGDGYIIFNEHLTRAYYSQHASNTTISLKLRNDFRTTKKMLYNDLDEHYNNIQNILYK